MAVPPKVTIRNESFYRTWSFCYAYLRENELVELEFYSHTPRKGDWTAGLYSRRKRTGLEVVFVEREEVGI